MKKTYASPRLFQYGEFADVVQWRYKCGRYYDFCYRYKYYRPCRY